jgi:aryl-alcohol dehydrogenase-like predicted oxidoreductase
MAIQQLAFGRTGHQSTRMIFGSAALARLSQSEADPTLDVLLEHGINHLDCAASYGDAELRLAPWLRQHPGRFFIATKTRERGAVEAREELHRSLDRLGVDHVDLWQLHNLVDPIEWDKALSPGGAVDAAVEAREQGLVKAIGVTGHGTQIAATHRRSLSRFDFGSVLLPYNYLTYANPYYASNFDALVQECQSRGAAVQTIKSLAYRPWMGRERTASTWYEPLADQPSIDLAVHWALSRRGIFVITTGDVGLLPKILDAAERFRGEAPSGEAMQQLVHEHHMEPLFV